MWDTFLITLINRWYVFVFLIAYLSIASLHWGATRTLKFLIFGYFIAWASEAASIRTGFPYGMYYYHYDQMAGEPFFFGVPVWDSASYVFLSFAGYLMALYLRTRWDRFTPLTQLQKSWLTVLLGAAMTMLLDIVIDPVAHLGSQWFLGDIYHYPPGGEYFDVPLTNFAGWFIVPLAIIGIFRLTDRLEGVPEEPKTILLGVALYGGVYFFNLIITFAIGAWKLGLASTAWGVFILILALIRPKQRRVQI
ncbi:MAG: carotenoid biosynthesis protein [Nitrospirales bacterium]|nr:carotenoid biosynthesis protein [Nitrospirales bacterium]